MSNHERRPAEAAEERMEAERPAAEEAAQVEGEAPTVEELVPLLDDARAKADEHWDQLLRVQAELENVRRRSARELENAHKYALERFVQELLPVKDSLELGLQAGAEAEGSAAKIIEGVDLTLKMLVAVLEKFGVQEIDPAGERFDPELHQAMSMQEAPGHEANTVVMVMQKGYRLHDRLVRPAMVVVAK
ncbi:nucleotide exchange factor GrpE [Ectothiorhodospiraceae bacterium 2226]|nr:nucleotide exchange factor GrpE [Ectothiorhodospiraceae bacterium 2226]